MWSTGLFKPDIGLGMISSLSHNNVISQYQVRFEERGEASNITPDVAWKISPQSNAVPQFHI